MKRPLSLTARLAVINLVLLAAVLGVVTFIEYTVARKQVDAISDARLASAGRMLRMLMDEEIDTIRARQGIPASLLSNEDKRAFRAELGKHLHYRVWFRGAINQATGGPDLPQPGADGFQSVTEGTVSWRVYSLVDPQSEVAITVAEPLRERREVIWTAVGDLVLPGLLLVPAMILALWAVSAYAMRRTRQFATQLAKRSASDLRPLHEGGWPREFQPLVAGTNKLLAHLDVAFEMERRLVDLAAHQLRTPLTSMLVQVHSARHAASPAELHQTLGRLETTLLQASSLTDRLLALARLDADALEPRRGDLRPELERAVMELLPIAEQREQSIEVEAVEQAVVPLDPADCRLVCSCLIENAVKYSPPETAIRVRLARRGTGFELTVEDEGPGIAEAERPTVLERFSRGRTGAGKIGSGLGLSIVQAAARKAGGTLALETAANGRSLLVRLTLPAAPAEVQPAA